METAEIVRFTVAEGRREDFLRDRPGALSALREAFPGLIEANLCEADDGAWIDIVRWTSREEAEAAAAGCASIPAFKSWMDMISEVQEMTHASLVHRVA